MQELNYKRSIVQGCEVFGPDSLKRMVYGKERDNTNLAQIKHLYEFQMAEDFNHSIYGIYIKQNC